MAKDVMDGFKIARLVHNPSKENTSKANNRTGNEKKGRILKKIKEAEEAGINLERLAELPHAPAQRGKKRVHQETSGLPHTSGAASPPTGQKKFEGAGTLLQLSQQPVGQTWNQQENDTIANPQWSFQTPCHRNPNPATPYLAQMPWQQAPYQQQNQAGVTEIDQGGSGYLAPDFEAFAGLASYTREPQLQQPLEPDFSTRFPACEDVFPQPRLHLPQRWAT